MHLHESLNILNGAAHAIILEGSGYDSLFCLCRRLKLQLHDAIYRLRFFSISLIHILSLSESHNNLASIQKNRGNKSHRVIVALFR